MAVRGRGSPASPVLLPTRRPATRGRRPATTTATAAVAATVRGALSAGQGAETAVRRRLPVGAGSAETRVATVAPERSDGCVDQQQRGRREQRRRRRDVRRPERQRRRRLGTGGPAAEVLRTAVAGRAPVARFPPVVGPAEDDRRRPVARRHRAGPQPNAHAALAAAVRRGHYPDARRHRLQNRTSRLR